jgi:hypothetical protein
MDKDKASMSSVWKDGRVNTEPHDVFKSKIWNANLGYDVLSGKTYELTCIHTMMDSEGAWWKVNFDTNILVTKIGILNRNDCCDDRLKGAKIFVDDTLFGTVPNPKKGAWSTFKSKIEGKSVKIQGAPN